MSARDNRIRDASCRASRKLLENQRFGSEHLKKKSKAAALL
jgi:hypothetical protein